MAQNNQNQLHFQALNQALVALTCVVQQLGQNIQGMQQQQNQMQQQLNQIQQQLNQMQQQLNQELQQNQHQLNQQLLQNQQEILVAFAGIQGLTIVERNGIYKLVNGNVKYPVDQLHPLLNAAGQSSPNFPLTKDALYELTVDNINANLQFYNLPQGGTRKTKIGRFSEFIGAN